MARELHADLRVVDTHDWLARDGSLWVFVFMSVSVPAIDGKHATAVPVLVREDD